jgi:hypothetical protein
MTTLKHKAAMLRLIRSVGTSSRSVSPARGAGLTDRREQRGKQEDRK